MVTQFRDVTNAVRQVLFLIPKNPPPQLDSHFSKPFRDFVAYCLQRDPRDVSLLSILCSFLTEMDGYDTAPGCA